MPSRRDWFKQMVAQTWLLSVLTPTAFLDCRLISYPARFRLIWLFYNGLHVLQRVFCSLKISVYVLQGVGTTFQVGCNGYRGLATASDISCKRGGAAQRPKKGSTTLAAGREYRGRPAARVAESPRDLQTGAQAVQRVANGFGVRCHTGSPSCRSFLTPCNMPRPI